jgi:hypothetical protein
LHSIKAQSFCMVQCALAETSYRTLGERLTDGVDVVFGMAIQTD